MATARLARVATAAAVAATALLGATLTATPAHAAKAATYKLSWFKTPDGKSHLLRWDPCAGPITFQVNTGPLRGAGKKVAVFEVKTEVARLAKASGLKFAYKGTTRYVPRSGNISKEPVDLVVAFVQPRQTDYNLAGPIAGEGGVMASYQGPVGGPFKVAVTKGYVVIDNPQTRRWSKAVRRNGVTRGALIAHELGHAVGLLHAQNPHEVMYPAMNALTPYTYAAGDRAGLAKVGAAAGCA